MISAESISLAFVLLLHQNLLFIIEKKICIERLESKRQNEGIDFLSLITR